MERKNAARPLFSRSRSRRRAIISAESGRNEVRNCCAGRVRKAMISRPSFKDGRWSVQAVAAAACVAAIMRAIRRRLMINDGFVRWLHSYGSSQSSCGRARARRLRRASVQFFRTWKSVRTRLVVRQPRRRFGGAGNRPAPKRIAASARNETRETERRIRGRRRRLRDK